MATVTATWRPSPRLIEAELVATGTAGPRERRLHLDLAALTPEQRKALLAYTRPTGAYTGAEPIFSEIALARHWVLPTDSRTDNGLARYEQKYLEFDAEPTLDQVLSTAQHVIDSELARQERERAIEAARRERERAQLAIYQRIRGEIEAIKSDLAALRAYQMAAEAHQVLSAPGRYLQPDTYLGSAADLMLTRGEYIAALEGAEREVDRQRWITEHGSPHLRRCIAAGYDCKRLYVVERAACEAPGFVVDFDDRAQWKTRACPSEAGLDAEQAARALGLGEPQIVWLSRPPRDQAGAGEDGAEFEPVEAVVLRGYLGQYDLVQIVAERPS